MHSGRPPCSMQRMADQMEHPNNTISKLNGVNLYSINSKKKKKHCLFKHPEIVTKISQDLSQKKNSINSKTSLTSKHQKLKSNHKISSPSKIYSLVVLSQNSK